VTRTRGPDETRRAVEAATKETKEAEAPARRLVLTPASEIKPEPVVWAWEDDGAGRIPAGSIGLFAGREGTGKSSFLIWLSARLTKGEPRPVIYVAVEDSWKYTIVPRLMAAGADLTMVYRAEVQTIEEETVTLSLPQDTVLLEEAIGQYGVALVAVDPLISAISDNLDTHVNRQVRQALDPLARMADRTRCIIGGIAHFNKSAGTDASSLITASGAFKDVSRFIFAFAVGDGDGESVITQTKNSLGRSDLPSLAYRIIQAAVPTTKGDANVGRLIIDGPSERTVQDILGDPGGQERDAKSRAEEYLRTALADGPQPSRDVEEKAREGYGISVRTLKRARAELRIPTAKNGDDGTWWISLPEHEGNLKEQVTGKSAKGANAGTLGIVAEKARGKSAKGAKVPSPEPVGTLGTLRRSDDEAH
jgi:hypothetical protein